MKMKMENMEFELSICEFMQIRNNVGFENMIKGLIQNEISEKCKTEIKKKVKTLKGKIKPVTKRASVKENSKKYANAVKLFKKGGIKKADALRKAGLPTKGCYYTVFDKKLKAAK